MDHIWYVYTLCGLFVGFIVGMTGVGGGSLMTPILVYLGIPPLKAVGTDLLYACLTKAGGIYVHHQKKTIDWKITGLMSLGSLPAALLTLVAMHLLGVNEQNSGTLIKTALGFALILTAMAMVFKQYLHKLGEEHGSDAIHRNPQKLAVATVVTGVVLGILVTVSSIGAGAIGTVALFFLYPRIATVRIVGSDIAHAVPLTLVAGLGHLAQGSVNMPLLGSLLLGSLPGIYVGSHLSTGVPDKVLRPLLAGMLVLIGSMMLAPLFK